MKKKEKKINYTYIIIYGVLIILSVILLFMFSKYKLESNFYCDTKLKRLCENSMSSYKLFRNIFIVFFLGTITFIILKLKDKKKKGILLTIYIITSILLMIVFPIIYEKIFENKLLKENSIYKLELYYHSKNDIKKIASIYEDKINDSIKNKDIATAIKYLDSYVDLKYSKTNEKKFMYQIFVLAIKKIDYYDEAMEYLSDLKDYKDIDQKQKELMYNYATKTKVTKNNYENIISILTDLKDFKDSNSKLKEIKYNFAKELTSGNDSQKAMTIYKELGNYKDSENQYNTLYSIHKFDGYWSGDEKSEDNYKTGFYIWIVNGTTCYNIYDKKTQKNAHDKYECKIENDKLMIYRITSKGEPMYTFNYVNGELVTSYDKFGTGRISTLTMTKKSDDTTLPDSKTIKAPSIGMTAEEVRASTWGNPTKINKSTYSWGTTEQWVYPNYKYIYFKNGRVTSITE